MDIKVLQVGKLGKSSKGNPSLSIRYEKGWINLSAKSKTDLEAIKKDETIAISDPQQFGSGWYGYFQGSVSAPEEEPGPSTDRNEALPWSIYVQTMEETHRIAKTLEPDDAQARCALVNTAMIGLTNGKVKPVGDDNPF